MGRRRKPVDEKARKRPEAIQPTAVYRREEIPGLLRVGRVVIQEAIVTGAIRHTMRGRRQLFLGEWLLEWIRARVSPGEGASATSTHPC